MNLEGTWHNELGSTMVIDQVRDGGFTGRYTTAVTPTGSAQGSFHLVGRTDADSGGEAIAFLVCWQNDMSNHHSVTAWSGQAQRINREDQITAMWLLTLETSPEQDWYATHVGHDIFTRARPTEEEITEIARMRQRSHP
jgi:Avidin family